MPTARVQAAHLLGKLLKYVGEDNARTSEAVSAGSLARMLARRWNQHRGPPVTTDGAPGLVNAVQEVFSHSIRIQ